MSPSLILASSSPYRRLQLEQLLQGTGIHFICQKPDFDETPLDNESPTDLVQRLAQGKAQSLRPLDTTQGAQPDALIIGSDQVAVHNNTILGKPHTVDNACSQLTQCSGQSVVFYTGLAVCGPQGVQVGCTRVVVQFRVLSASEIQRYVAIERPLDCAGSFKSEGLGVSLFESIQSDDQSALIGLPLIMLCEMMRQHGMEIP